MKFDQYIQYRSLSFKATVDGENFNSEASDRILDKQIKNHPDIKTVCTPIHIELFERLEETLSVLNISKRAFIQMAIVEALDRADAIMEEVDIFENHHPEIEASAEMDQKEKAA